MLLVAFADTHEGRRADLKTVIGSACCICAACGLATAR